MSGHSTDDAILPVDIVVVAHDLMWGSDHLNSLSRRFPDANVVAAVTLLQAGDDLSPGHPAVVLVGPTAAEEALEQLDAMRPEPNVAVLIAVDEPDGDLGRRILEQTGIAPLDATDAAAVDFAVDTALYERRRGAASFPGAEAANDDDDLLLVGPSGDMRIVVLTAGKGGTGTTTTAINLAAALARDGERVTIVDAHKTTGDVGLLLGVHPLDDLDLDDLTIDHRTIEYFTTQHEATGLRVVNPPSDGAELESLTVEQLLRILVALEATTDVAVVDIPLDLVVSSEIAGFVGAILLVTTGQLASVKNTLIAADVLGRRDHLAVVLNDIQPHATNPDHRQIESLIKVQVLGELPFDDDIHVGATATPLNAISRPKSGYGKRCAELAHDLVRQFVPPPES